jgi:hypothetical protein
VRVNLDRRTTAVLAVTCAVSVALVVPRAVVLGQSLWNDEIVSIQRYISGGPSTIFSRYLVDNHMLYDLLAWLTIRLPGAPDALYRLWGSIPFLIGVGILTGWLRKRSGDLSAMVFLILAAASPLLLELTTSARGYGIAFLAMAGLVIASYEAATTRERHWLTLFCLAALTGTWTLPTFVLPAAGMSVALLFTAPDLRRAFVLRLTLTVAAIAVWYAPVATLVHQASKQHYGQPLAWHAPLTGGFTLVTIAFIPGVTSVTKTCITVFLAPLLLIGVREAHRRMHAVVAPTLAAITTTFAALTAGRFFVEVRFLSYLLVPLLIYLALGAAALLKDRQTRWQRVVARVYVGLVVGCAAGLFVFAASATVRRPYEDNRGAAEAIVAADAGGKLPILVNLHAPNNLRYYLPRWVRLSALPRGILQQQICESHPRGLIFVQQPFLVENVNASCLARAGAHRQRFLQRSRGGHITVWVVPPKG